MPTKIAVMNLKGGTGKSTIACAVAVQAAEQGRTLLIDADVDQACASKWLAGDPEEGVVSKTDYPNLDVVWIRKARQTPSLAEYEYVVIDGRPAERIGEYTLGTADILVAPFTDKEGRGQGLALASHFASHSKCAMIIFNVITVRASPKMKEHPGRLAYDKALRTHRWKNVREPLFASIMDRYDEWRGAEHETF